MIYKFQISTVTVCSIHFTKVQIKVYFLYVYIYVQHMYKCYIFCFTTKRIMHLMLYIWGRGKYLCLTFENEQVLTFCCFSGKKKV